MHPASSTLQLLSHLLCNKIAFPAMNNICGIHKIFQKDCCFEECEQCKDFSLHADCILSCPAIFNDKVTYVWMAYQQHELDVGTLITELRETGGNGLQLRESLLKQLSLYKKHYFKYRWLQLMRKFDVATLSPTDIYIQTDYGAQPVLDSQDKLNSTGHGVCVLSCWLIMHSPQVLKYIDGDGVSHNFTYYECDHTRVITPSKGKFKDQDYFLHCEIFDFLLQKYILKIKDLKRVIVWTDGAPNQYKCRHNFFWLSQIKDKYSLQICHRFGATAQFKGVHDKIGQVAKAIVG